MIITDAIMQDTTTQDTDIPDAERRIAKMKTPRKNEKETLIRNNHWVPTESLHLLHLYTVNNNKISTHKDSFHHRTGVVASLTRDMTARVRKTSPRRLLSRI